MSKQRLVFIETTYGKGIVFDQEDSALAYKLLSRATPVTTAGAFVSPVNEDIDFKLIAPERFAVLKEEEPEPPLRPAPTEDPAF